MNPKKYRILIVEDEPDIRGEIHEFFSLIGFIIYEASRPSEAFLHLSANPIDIIILDCCLPEMTGLDTLIEMKRKYPEIPVIMMSGSGDKESESDAMQLGAFDYLQKPFRLHELLACIDRAGKFNYGRKHKKHEHSGRKVKPSYTQTKNY
jgi:DNA-binding NtrC family response regulator